MILTHLIAFALGVGLTLVVIAAWSMKETG